jgi:hypothetical protein
VKKSTGNASPAAHAGLVFFMGCSNGLHVLIKKTLFVFDERPDIL